MVKQKTIRGLLLQHIRKMFRGDQLYTITQKDHQSDQGVPVRMWSRRSLWIRHLDCGSCNGC